MTPVKISVLILLILGVFCQCLAALYPGRPKECCYGYKGGKPLPVKSIRSYYRTPSDCSSEAVVFVMKNGKNICTNPRTLWVKKTMSVLNRKK